MTLQTYLAHRRRFEVAIAIAITALICATGATNEIIENLREGQSSDWLEAWAKELSSGVVVLALLPAVAGFLNRLNLNISNLRAGLLWLLAGFVAFSFAHIAGLTAVRTAIWAVNGKTYEFGPVGLGLLYEMRKDFVVYVGIVALLSGYQFILNRLRGEAKFLAAKPTQAADRPAEPPVQRQQFLVKMLNKEYLVRVEEIDWIQSASNYVLLHCGARTYPMRGTLASLVAALDPQQFMRVHRTAIINLNRVATLSDAETLRATLDSGDQVPVSRTHLPELKKVLAG